MAAQSKIRFGLVDAALSPSICRYTVSMQPPRVLLVLAVLLFTLGSSRPLASKDTEGAFSHLPGGFVAAGPPRAFLGEDVDNQGCLARQRLELAIALPLRNDGLRTLVLEEARAVLYVDGSPQAPRRRTVEIGDQRSVVDFRRFTLHPGQLETVRVRSNAFASKAALEEIETVELVVPTDGDEIRATFSFRDVPTRMAPLHADDWESGVT